VVVSPTYKLEKLRGCAGFVELIETNMVDADRLDQYGYVEKHAYPHTSVAVRLAGQPVYQFVFHDLDDLTGHPSMVTHHNPHWI
jgi:hypothetical protein